MSILSTAAALRNLFFLTELASIERGVTRKPVQLNTKSQDCLDDKTWGHCWSDPLSVGGERRSGGRFFGAWQCELFFLKGCNLLKALLNTFLKVLEKVASLGEE
jgi:hypothetical protein